MKKNDWVPGTCDGAVNCAVIRTYSLPHGWRILALSVVHSFILTFLLSTQELPVSCRREKAEHQDQQRAVSGPNSPTPDAHRTPRATTVAAGRPGEGNLRWLHARRLRKVPGWPSSLSSRIPVRPLSIGCGSTASFPVDERMSWTPRRVPVHRCWHEGASPPKEKPPMLSGTEVESHGVGPTMKERFRRVADGVDNCTRAVPGTRCICTVRPGRQ